MNGRRAATFGIGMALAATSLASSPLTAQDQSFSLPTQTASPRAQGPVDNDNPIVISTPRPEPSIPPAPSPSPTPTATAASPRPTVRPTAAPSPAPTRPQAAPSQPAATASPTPSTAPSAEPAPTEAAPLPAQSDTATTASAAESLEPTNWPLFGGITLLLLLLGIGVWKLRRKAEPEASDELEWVSPAPEPAPAPPEPVPAPAPDPAHAPVPAEPIPSPAFAAPNASPLACTLEAKRISATLLNAQLDYRIELVNNSDQTIELIAIHGDMIGAHASLGSAQLAQGQTGLPVLHRVPRLAAGERTELSGSIRLPLAQIQAVRQGSAALFVPLVRLRTQATMHDGWAIALPQSFVIGEPPLSDGSGLRPFRLDMGPRIYNQVLARIVTPAD